MNNTQPQLLFKHLVLASGSPRRRQFLEEAHIPLLITPADIDENEATTGDPEAIAVENACSKGRFISKNHPNELVLAADSVVALEAEVFHKPSDIEEAKKMLRKFSGKRQSVYTGLCFLCPEANIEETHCIVSHIDFKELTEDTISTYVKLVDPLDRAGGWSIQDHSEMLIQGYKGSFSNIAGLPIEFVLGWLKEKAVRFKA